MLVADRPAVRPEEHPEARLRRPQRPHGHEHHLQREEGDQVAWVAHQLGTGGQRSRGRQDASDRAHQSKDSATSRSHFTGKHSSYICDDILLYCFAMAN